MLLRNISARVRPGKHIRASSAAAAGSERNNGCNGPSVGEEPRHRSITIIVTAAHHAIGCGSIGEDVGTEILIEPLIVGVKPVIFGIRAANFA